MGYEAVDIYVKDQTPSKFPVAGVVVKVLSLDGMIVYGQSTTDSDGHVGFLLPAEFQYALRFYKFATGFKQPLILTVEPTPLAPGHTNVFDVPAVILDPPVPTDDRLCTAFGYFRDPSGAPQPNVRIYFVAKFDPAILDGAALVKERIGIRTDDTGYAQVNLIRNGQYDCTIAGEEDIVRTISVPDQPNVNMPDLIFPVVNRVVLEPPPPYELAVGEELEVGLEVFASTGLSLGNGLQDVNYKTSDSSIAFPVVMTATMKVVGVAPGAATFTLERKDKSIVTIPDTGIEGSPIQVVVTP